MKYVRLYLAICACFIFASDTIAQLDDNVLWASVRLRYVPKADHTFDLRPFYRANENFSNYQNWSIDYSYTYRVSPHWRLGVLGRTWFLPDGSNRQFFWPSITYNTNLGNYSFNNRFMLHQAFDIQDVPDADFFRIKPSIANTFGKLRLELHLEPWFRFDGLNEFWRMRYELSASTKLTDHLSAGLMYRMQYDKGDFPDVVHYVTTITYRI